MNTIVSRRRLLAATSIVPVAIALNACNGLSAQQVASDVIQIFQTAITATSALLAQMGVAVPASIVSMITKIQTIASKVVAGIEAVAASGYVQQAFGIFNQIVSMAGTAVAAAGLGGLPSVFISGVAVVTKAFQWLMQALPSGTAPTAAAVAGPAASPAAIMSDLNQIIAAAR